MDKAPVHTISKLGHGYAVNRVKAPTFFAIYQDGQLIDIVFDGETPANADALVKKALAFVNSHLTMQSKQ